MPRALIVVDDEGENQIAVCAGANACVKLDDVRFRPDEAVLTQLEIPHAVVTQLAGSVPGFFAVNAAPATHLSPDVLERADLVIVNESEYALLPELATAQHVAVTLGAEGAALLHRGQQVAFAPAVAAVPVNTVGAGDAFCAALTIALCSGLPETEALVTACAVGAAAVSSPSAQPALETLDAYLPA
jgi:ribokinase